MFVFVCAECDAELTVPLSQVALPPHAHQKYGNGVQLPVLMESGTFAVASEPWASRRPTWDEICAGELARWGVHAPVATQGRASVHAPSEGAPGAIVVAPGDTRGTLLIPEKRGGACCGLDGADGPNMACEACGLPVASRIDDCSLWQAVWFAPNAVHRRAVGGVDPVPLSWEELTEAETRTPPFEPIATWGGRMGTSHYWSWSPRWEAAAGQALAHLVAASQGGPVTVPDGLANDVFQRTLDILLPAGQPARKAVLAGPGHPASDPQAAILLVPVHPQTGELWSPAGPAASASLVPLPFGVWLWLAFPAPHLPLPASGCMPDEVLRDDPPAPHPSYLFRVDAGAFQRTLARLPAVRSPWLRATTPPIPRPGSDTSRHG